MSEYNPEVKLYKLFSYNRKKKHKNINPIYTYSYKNISKRKCLKCHISPWRKLLLGVLLGSVLGLASAQCLYQ